MNQALLKNVLIIVCLLGFTGAESIFAQIAPNPIVKSKNSPFSPNPRKKTTAVSATPAQDENAGKTVEISKAPVTAPQSTDGDGSTVSQKTPVSSELGDGANQNFESRSVASKTLEVAKKASAVSVTPTEIYKIGIGDVLFVGLKNAPAKESNYFTVLNNGTIDYPLAGEMVSVAGLTTDQVEDLLKEKIKLYENPQVSVKIREANSHTFTVLGLVEKPGEKTMPREAMPLYVVRAEAIAQSRANSIVIKRAGSDTQTVDMKDSKYGEVLIFPGDIVEFRADDAAAAPKVQFYYIGGEVVSGGQKDFYQGITLTQAILASGGLKKSSVKKVIVRRKNDTGLLTPSEYDLKAIKEGKSVDPILQVGDTVEVGNQ